MQLYSLKPAKGSIKSSKRIGRGTGSGKGGTSTKGHKGDKARSGHKDKLGFEGGQMPLQRRIPKFGFTNINRVEFKGINLDTIQDLISSKDLVQIDFDTLYSNGLVSKRDKVKLLGRGELKSKVIFKLHAFTQAAKASVEAAGGTIEIV